MWLASPTSQRSTSASCGPAGRRQLDRPGAPSHRSTLRTRAGTSTLPARSAQRRQPTTDHRRSPRPCRCAGILPSLEVPSELVATTTYNTVIVPAHDPSWWIRQPPHNRHIGGSRLSGSAPRLPPRGLPPRFLPVEAAPGLPCDPCTDGDEQSECQQPEHDRGDSGDGIHGRVSV